MPTCYLVRWTGLVLPNYVEWNYARNWNDPTARVARRKFWLLLNINCPLESKTQVNRRGDYSSSGTAYFIYFICTEHYCDYCGGQNDIWPPYKKYCGGHGPLGPPGSYATGVKMSGLMCIASRANKS